MLLLGQQHHETAFHPHWQTSRTYVFSRLRRVNFAIVTRISRPNVGISWQFHCFSLWEGSRSFGDFTVIWKYFKSTSFYDAKNYIISTTIAYNVQPHVTHRTATDNKWLVKAAQKHRSVSNRTFALHRRFNLSIPKLLRPTCLDATSKQNGVKHEGHSLFQRSRKSKETAKSRAQQLSLRLIANSRRVRRS